MFVSKTDTATTKILLESVASVDFTGDSPLTITLRDGSKLEGDFAPVEFSGQTCGQAFQAFDRYGPNLPEGAVLTPSKTKRFKVE